MTNIVMTKEHKDTLQTNYEFLKLNLVDLNLILDIFYSKNIFSYDEIQAIKSNSNQIFEFINKLRKQPDNAYFIFLYALQETYQHHIISRIDSNCFKQDGVDSIKNLEKLDISILEMKTMKSDFKKQIFTMRETYNFKESQFYGRALIINNSEFDTHDFRTGSDLDTQDLKLCFELLHYKVKILENLTASDMIRELKEESSNEEHRDMQSLVVCMMSHGAKDCVYGVDGHDTLGLVSIRQILNIFNGENCKALQGKPKLFFIQACQINLRRNEDEFNTSIQVENEDRPCHPLSDIFYFISAVPGEKSWRDPSRGSLFINALVYSIYTLAHEETLQSIANKVIDLLQTREIWNDGSKLQLPYCHSTLRKKFYFMP